MKKVCLSLTFFYIGLAFLSCKPESSTNGSDVNQSSEPFVYDSLLAQKLGADEYGMKTYVMAFLKSGSVVETDSIKAAQIQRAHLDNIFRLADEGKLVLAGPYLDDSEFRGVYVFNVSTVEEAKALAETDPGVKEGYFVMEYHPWYGSATLVEVNTRHKLIQKTKI